jgi:methyl-accepting chemotaxis protein
VTLAERAGSLLGAIVPSINKTSDLVQEIAAASSEQSSGVSQINNAMNQLSQLTQQNASASEKLAATSENMSGEAQNLLRTVSFFSVAEDAGNAESAAPAKLVVARKPGRQGRPAGAAKTLSSRVTQMPLAAQGSARSAAIDGDGVDVDSHFTRF